MTRELREEARRREEERERAARRREEFLRDVRETAARPEGMRLLRWVLDGGGIFRADWHPGELAAYQAGQRFLALRLWHTLRDALDPQTFAALVLGESTGDRQRPGYFQEAATAGLPFEEKNYV